MASRIPLIAVLAASLMVATPAYAQGNQPAQEAGPQQKPAETGPRWQNLPRMQLEAVYAAPLADTVIQRLRDPIDGTICFLYSPIEAPHSPPSGSGYVSYGGVNVGSISCVAGSVIAIPNTPPAPPVQNYGR